MLEELQDSGLLSDGSGPGLDPLEAVHAVAGPRAGAAGEESTPASPDEMPGMLVETRVQIGGETAGSGSEEPADDGYGDFAWPDGYGADPAAMARFVPLAKKLGLTKECAQSLASLYAELDQERHRAQAEFVSRNNAEWLREIQSHPEFGGTNLQRTGEEVASVMRRFGSPLLTAQIRQMNIQNWPEMFYFLARVARAAGEDCSPSGSRADAPRASTAELLFPGLN